MNMTVADQLCIQGLEAKRNGYYAEAINLYEQARRLQPNDLEIYFNMGKILFILKQYKLSVDAYLCCCEEVLHGDIPISELSPNFLMHLGWSYMALQSQDPQSGCPEVFHTYMILYRAEIDPYYKNQLGDEYWEARKVCCDDMERITAVLIQNAMLFIDSLIKKY